MQTLLEKKQGFHFELIHQSRRSRARVGRIHTPHGIIETPGFVAVGTNGTLKSLPELLLKDLDLDLMFCNTYHLMLQPGAEVVEKAGGLHAFLGRNKPIITDSGGFQVFSLAYGSVAKELKSQGKKERQGGVLKITEEGVLFRSYRDGKKVFLSPETSIQAQKQLGADIIIPFDELPPYHISPEYLKESLDRTHRWEIRSLRAHLENPKNQAMYAVLHGGIDEQLRKESLSLLSKHPFDGFAIGGSFGKTKEQMLEMLHWICPSIPDERPIHLLGIADLPSIEAAIPLGIDTFDSAYPTRMARHGTLLTENGPCNITKGIYATDFSPIEEGCCCPACQSTTKGYLHHLFKAKEASALTLATIHNVYFMVKFMKSYRNLILDNVI